jgi:KDO2-lipid IV(A) lauroyltransferase
LSSGFFLLVLPGLSPEGWRIRHISLFLFARRWLSQNLTNAFGKSKSEAEIRSIARATYQQFAQTMVELIFFPKLTAEDSMKRNGRRWKTFRSIDAVSKLGKGAVFVGAHYGNWELMGAALAQHISRYPTS